MAIIVTTEGNGVLFNGTALAGKEGWVLSTSGDQSKVTLTNKITGLSGSALTTEVEVDGSTFADYDALVAALGPILFKGAGTGPVSGVQSVTGDGVDNSDPDNPVISYPTPGDIGAATAAQGSLADSAVQPGDLPPTPTWATLSGKPSTFAPIIGTAANEALAGNTVIPTIPSTISQAEVETGTATTQRTITAQRVRQGANAAIAASDKVSSTQEGGVGTLITNIIQVTQSQYDNLTPQSGTFYAIVG